MKSIIKAFRRKADWLDISQLARSRSASHNQLTNCCLSRSSTVEREKPVSMFAIKPGYQPGFLVSAIRDLHDLAPFSQPLSGAITSQGLFLELQPKLGMIRTQLFLAQVLLHPLTDSLRQRGTFRPHRGRETSLELLLELEAADSKFILFGRHGKHLVLRLYIHPAD
ncbi:hypothetical protein [Pseudomonas guariconensis]|uniref:hypothetical protein n=1 Tax=Pseudomonas guariconensis TaxID=1288410 RepID=UPI003F6E4418